MEIDEPNLAILRHPLKNAIGREEGTINWAHEYPAQETSNPDRKTLFGGDDTKLLAGSARREVGGFDDVPASGEDGDDLPFFIDMIAQSDGVDPSLHQFFVLLSSETGAVGGVLGVSDDGIDLADRTEPRNRLANHGDTWFPNDIADKHQSVKLLRFRKDARRLVIGVG
jgi:hypothetical protein